MERDQEVVSLGVYPDTVVVVAILPRMEVHRDHFAAAWGDKTLLVASNLLGGGEERGMEAGSRRAISSVREAQVILLKGGSRV